MAFELMTIERSSGIYALSDGFFSLWLFQIKLSRKTNKNNGKASTSWESGELYPGYLLASSTMLHCFLGIAPIAFSPLYYFHFMYAPLRCLEFQSPGRCNGKWIGRYRGVLSGAISPPGLLLFLFLVLWMGLVLILGVLCSVFIFWFIFCSCRVEIVSVSVDSFCSFEVTRGRDNW